MTLAEAADHLAWERALDELEAFTYLAEAQLRTFQPIETDRWAMPELGPLPPDLAERARELLSHQQRLLGDLPIALDRVRQQRSVTERFSQTAGRTRGAVYVDRTA